MSFLARPFIICSFPRNQGCLVDLWCVVDQAVPEDRGGIFETKGNEESREKREVQREKEEGEGGEDEGDLADEEDEKGQRERRERGG